MPDKTPSTQTWRAVIYRCFCRRRVDNANDLIKIFQSGKDIYLTPEVIQSILSEPFISGLDDALENTRLFELIREELPEKQKIIEILKTSLREYSERQKTG